MMNDNEMESPSGTFEDWMDVKFNMSKLYSRPSDNNNDELKDGILIVDHETLNALKNSMDTDRLLQEYNERGAQMMTSYKNLKNNYNTFLACSSVKPKSPSSSADSASSEGCMTESGVNNNERSKSDLHNTSTECSDDQPLNRGIDVQESSEMTTDVAVPNTRVGVSPDMHRFSLLCRYDGRTTLTVGLNEHGWLANKVTRQLKNRFQVIIRTIAGQSKLKTIKLDSHFSRLCGIHCTQLEIVPENLSSWHLLVKLKLHKGFLQKAEGVFAWSVDISDCKNEQPLMLPLDFPRELVQRFEKR